MDYYEVKNKVREAVKAYPSIPNPLSGVNFMTSEVVKTIKTPKGLGCEISLGERMLSPGYVVGITLFNGEGETLRNSSCIEVKDLPLLLSKI